MLRARRLNRKMGEPGLLVKERRRGPPPVTWRRAEAGSTRLAPHAIRRAKSRRAERDWEFSREWQRPAGDWLVERGLWPKKRHQSAILQRESGRADRSLTPGANRAGETEARRWRWCQHQEPLRSSLGVVQAHERRRCPSTRHGCFCGRDGWVGSSGRPRQWDRSVHRGGLQRLLVPSAWEGRGSFLVAHYSRRMRREGLSNMSMCLHGR